MPKTFEYKDAKEEIKFYKDLISKLENLSSIKNKYKSDLLYQTRFLYNRNYFLNIIKDNLEKDINIDYENDDFKTFISKIYYYKEISKYNTLAKTLYDSYSQHVKSCISALSPGKNALSWLFASKQKKSNVEDAYKELVDLKNQTFVTSSLEIFKSIENIEKTDFKDIFNDYISSKEEYKTTLLDANPDVFNENGNLSIFKPYINEYKSINDKVETINASVISCSNDIKNSLERLIGEQLLESLRQIPVEELARDKSGIKTKYLKDAGYNNLANVFVASQAQIASIYGISQDKAYTIKSKCDNYARNLKRELKIKLSVDNKTRSSTKLVENIYIYLKKKEYIKQIDTLKALYDNELEQSIKTLDDLKNGVKWPFLTDDEIDNVKENYKKIKDNLIPLYRRPIEEIYNNFGKSNVLDSQAWNDFASRSIEYYNVIEELCPGVLGNDDVLYGLPEDLAREIQDECFFPDGLLCTLRKYQEWGVKYILHQEKVLLGDEMGLGKTIQAIATMVSLKNTGATHFLVICPASVVTNWCREITKHSKLSVTKIHGTYKKSAFNSWLKTGGVGVTNFESTSYIKLDDNYKFDLLVVDEAHYIKNINANRSVNTRNIASHTDRLLFMTGTALENKVDEMISLIDVLRPSIGNDIKKLAFMSSAPQFREKIAPVYYRRKREDVLTELPDKIENKEWCSLNPEEEKIYEETLLSKKYQDIRRVSWNIDDLSKSCKAQRLKEIVQEAELEDRKVLVFSFYLDTINKIHHFLNGKCLNPITGSVSVNRRQEIIDEFDKAPSGTVLLAQINSGGTGLNIQSASVVVICEPQLKPSIENQAISRAYRMGQSRNVLVYRLLCENSVDEKLVELLEKKQKEFDTYADKSVAAQQTTEISEETFGEIINEEIERIKKKNENNSSNLDSVS